MAKAELTVENIVRALKHHAFHDARKLLEKGAVKDIEDMDLETGQTISGFDCNWPACS